MPNPQQESSDRSTHARILVIDNREQVLLDLKRGLETSGYHVETAGGAGQALHNNALKTAKMFRPHVAIVDLRLDDDSDTSDTSGLELLRTLQKQCQGLKLIVYSAYLNPTVDRAISELGATWVDKSDAPAVLRTTVAKLAVESCATSRSFLISWPRGWKNHRTLWKLFGKEIPATLLDDVISQLFSQTRRVTVHHVEAKDTPSASPVSRGRSLVIKVQPGGVNVKKVVKVAIPKRIKRETKNYHRFIHDKMPGQFHTRLEASRVFWDVGASVYSFLGDNDAQALQTFRDFYIEEHDTQKLLDPVRRFWTEVWRFQSPRSVSVKPVSLYREYDKLLDLKHNLERIAEHDFRVDTEASDAIDPVAWVQQRREQIPKTQRTRYVIHGDFHADNLFTDSVHIWVVDFERTGYGPVYADFCELEIDTLTRLLPSSVELAEFRRIIDCLVDFDAAAQDARLSPPSQKAVAFIRGLRLLAFQTTAQRQVEDYCWGILCDSLFVAGMRVQNDMATEHTIQRERAWHYASAICTRL